MTELVDTSVWARKRQPGIRPWFDSAIVEGDIAMCDVVALELLHSASTAAIYRAVEANLAALPQLAMGADTFERARTIYRRLAELGNALHRSVKHADVLIAACADVHGITLVHYDHDYDAIASVSGQPMRWVAPRGTIP